MEQPSVPDSSRLRHRVRLHTRWSDEDNQAVLNNAVYLTLMEEARHAYFSTLGLLAANRFPFLLAQVNVAFTAPGRGGVDVIVEMATTHLGTTSFTQCYRVRDAASGDVWCEAEARLVCYDPAKSTKMPLDSAFRRAIEVRESGST